MAITTNIIQVILVSLIVTFVCAPLSIWIAKRAQLIDFPGSAPHKCHLKPTPMAGGVLLVLAFLVSGSLLFAWRIPGVAATFGAGLVVFLFGLCDDLWDISPIIKLIGQILAALILIQSNVWMQFFEPLDFILRLPPLMLHWLSVLMTIFWLVAITNAFNFIDNMDGLAVGIGGLVAVFIMFFSIGSGQFELAKLSVGLAALCAGVYFFNAKPAFLFLGDAGAQVLGFWLATLAITYHPTSIAIQRSPWFTIILIMGVPIFDMTLVVVSRLLRGTQFICRRAITHTTVWFILVSTPTVQF